MISAPAAEKSTAGVWLTDQKRSVAVGSHTIPGESTQAPPTQRRVPGHAAIRSFEPAPGGASFRRESSIATKVGLSHAGFRREDVEVQRGTFGGVLAAVRAAALLVCRC